MGEKTSLRYRELEERGWTSMLVSLYLTSRGHWFKIADVEAAERSAEWQRDKVLADAGEPIRYTTKDLADRGWSRTMITKFLGAPYQTRKLSKNRVMYYYLPDDVYRAEATPQWREASASAAKRSKVGKQVAERKTAELVATIEGRAYHVTEMSRRELIDRACEHYNEMWAYRGRPEKVATRDDPAFLARICVNYLRHQCTEYDGMYDEFYAKMGARKAGWTMRRDIFNAIAEAYPYLANECIRQRDKPERQV